MEEFLDWLVSLDIQHYPTESFPNYTPTGKSHFYLKGSPERFNSKEMLSIWENKATNEVLSRWQYTFADHVRYNKKHRI